MVLSDRTIKEEVAAGRLVFDPYDESLVQPSSVDMRVDSAFRVFNNTKHPYIDVRKPMDDLTELVRVDPASPSSSTRASSCSARRWSGSSSPTTSSPGSRARLALAASACVIHSTAGFVDPGFEGNLTLELSNLANLPITIYEGMPIGQISFMRMDRAVENAYGASAAGSKYQGQAEPTASRYYLNFENGSAQANGAEAEAGEVA